MKLLKVQYEVAGNVVETLEIRSDEWSSKLDHRYGVLVIKDADRRWTIPMHRVICIKESQI